MSYAMTCHITCHITNHIASYFPCHVTSHIRSHMTCHISGLYQLLLIPNTGKRKLVNDDVDGWRNRRLFLILFSLFYRRRRFENLPLNQKSDWTTIMTRSGPHCQVRVSYSRDVIDDVSSSGNKEFETGDNPGPGCYECSLQQGEYIFCEWRLL